MTLLDGSFVGLGSGLAHPRWPILGPGGTAFAVVDNGIARIDLNANTWSRFGPATNAAVLASEPGKATALMMVDDTSGDLGRNLWRINLTTGASDLLVGGMFSDESAMVEDPTNSYVLLSENRAAFNGLNSAALLQFAVP